MKSLGRGYAGAVRGFNLSSGMGGKVTSFLFDQKNETRCFFDHHYSVILTNISTYFEIFGNFGHHSKVILRKKMEM